MPILSFTLSGEVVPKARPRLSLDRVHLPMKYRNWKNNAIASLTKQKEGMEAEFPLRGVVIAICLRGKHHRGSDSDNILGSILDALVQAKVLKNDNMTAVTGASIYLLHSEDAPTVTLSILVGMTSPHIPTWEAIPL